MNTNVIERHDGQRWLQLSFYGRTIFWIEVDRKQISNIIHTVPPPPFSLRGHNLHPAFIELPSCVWRPCSGDYFDLDEIVQETQETLYYLLHMFIDSNIIHL